MTRRLAWCVLLASWGLLAVPGARADTEPLQDVVDGVVQLLSHPPRPCGAGGICILDVDVSIITDRIEELPKDIDEVRERVEGIRVPREPLE